MSKSLLAITLATLFALASADSTGTNLRGYTFATDVDSELQFNARN